MAESDIGGPSLDRPEARAGPRRRTAGGYDRVLLKVSGEAFGGGGVGVDPDVVATSPGSSPRSCATGVQVGVVVGGGNFFRGAELPQRGMDRSRADYMGMLGTVMNCLALQDFLEKQGIETRVQTAIAMGQVAEPYIPRGPSGTWRRAGSSSSAPAPGMPYFSTDTVAAQRALEIDCQVLLMGKNGVDGVYDADPRKHPEAKQFDVMTYAEVLAARPQGRRRGRVQPLPDNKLPIVVFDLLVDGNIARAVRGERIGTLVTSA